METRLGSFYIPIITKVLCFLNLCISYSDICMLYVYICLYTKEDRSVFICEYLFPYLISNYFCHELSKDIWGTGTNTETLYSGERRIL